MYKEIYEAEPFYGINVAFIVLCIVTVLIVLLLCVFWKIISIGDRCFISFITAFLLFIIFSQIYVAVDAKHKVYDEYAMGNYLVIEGVIYDYYTSAGEEHPDYPDYFCVNDIDFMVPGFASCWGYPLRQVDGGVLRNGMKVRICYINYKYENVIMKLEEYDIINTNDEAPTGNFS